MKRILNAITAVALIAATPLPAFAADNTKSTGDQIIDAASAAWKALKKGAREAWDATVKAFDSMTEGTKDIMLPAALPSALSGKQLIGTTVQNSTEGKVGRIADVVVGNDNFMDAFIVEDGGFLGIGADKVPVKPRLITVTRSPDGSLKARTNITEAQLDTAADGAFVSRIEAMNENFKNSTVKTVARLLAASVVDTGGRTVATVHDILLSPVGEAQYAILKVDNGARLVAVRVSSLGFTRAGEPLKTTMTADQLHRRAAVRY
ncbi:MAG: PRC-barrel domain-containing protein [Micropepsaceae bacterium]